MSNTTTEDKSELITLAETNAKSLFDGSSMDSMLSQIEVKARSYDLDISTPNGRKEIASVAYKIAQSKTAIDAAGKKMVEGIKAEAKVIDDERKKARDFLDNLKDEIRKPLTDFENAEKEREAQAKDEAERKAAALVAEQEAKRAANKKHREKVIAVAVGSLIEQGVDSVSAWAAVEAISEGKIPSISIQF